MHFLKCKKSQLIRTFALGISGGSLLLPRQIDAVETSPNIILIYIDDLGYSDTSCYGREYGNTLTETPNIDRLAQQGMRFTSAYAAAPICSASRAALLTGRSPARLGFEFVTAGESDVYHWDDPKWKEKYPGYKLLPPPYTLALPLEETTLAEALKPMGYVSAISGKWHVAPHYKKYLGWSPVYGPAQQGFDWTAETFGCHPYEYKYSDPTKGLLPGQFPDDELTDKAIEFLDQKHDSPFFLFVSHYYVHTPIDDRLTWLVDKYTKKAARLPEKYRKNQIRYAAFVETMDHFVGQLLDAIDAAGLSTNTLVILSSDNGGNPVYAFNRPLRGGKWSVYEGGTRIPFIVRWPGVVKQGTVCDVPVIQTDLMPTFCDVAGGKSPDVKLDGTSIMALLKGQPMPELADRAMLWHFPYYHPEGKDYARAKDEIGEEDGCLSKTYPQSAIRKGKYKLVWFYEDSRAELYDLENDASESHDISAVFPEITKEMEELLFAELKSSNARIPRVQSE